MVSELLQKYIWLVQTFIRKGDRGLSLDEIVRKWEIRWGTVYSRRTFNNHREAVADVFGINIECNRSTMCYFIKYSEDVQDQNADAAWLINTFTVNNLLSLGKERLSGRVSVEDIPSGQKFLTILMDAMLDNKEIRISYRKYTDIEEEVFNIQPYALKEFAKRWYLVGYCLEREDLRVYGLDRILSINILDTVFDLPAGFDVDELLSPAFGIYLPKNKKPVEIVFAATKKEARYLADLPIHHSQKMSSFKDFAGTAVTGAPGKVYDEGRLIDKVIFKINVVPDDALIMELCRRGDRIEVLWPHGVRRLVALELKRASAIYSDITDDS